MPSPSPKRRGPKPVADILGELFAARGLGRLRARRELEDAWAAAVGEPGCRQTRLGEVRRGVLSVTVTHPALLEELAAFQKPALLAALRQAAPGTVVHDIRFRVGPVDHPPAAADGGGNTDGPQGPRPRRPRGGPAGRGGR
jgi:predicted nucleic acid-binding Zn ribbon protein